MAADQRYCLECGERRAQMSSILVEGLKSPAASASDAGPSGAQGQPAASAGQPQTAAVIAGVGVLLLSMGVGVLIGRSSSSQAKTPQVLSVAAPSSAGSTPTAAAATPASFTSDWPAGTTAYTVQLQTLPESGTQVSAVAAAKAAASAKGATGVGALKSSAFSSLPAGSYVIYSGTYPKKADAEKAQKRLKASFPGATVIRVSSSSSSSASSSSEEPSPTETIAGGVGQTPSKPAPPSVLKNLRTKSGGQSYEQKSKNLPNVVETP